MHGDPVEAAKALRDFARTQQLLTIKGGLLGERVMSQADVEALAEIQPREVLLARIAGGLQAPLAKAAGLFSALQRNTAYGIKALIDQRIAAGEAPPPPAAEAAASRGAPRPRRNRRPRPPSRPGRADGRRGRRARTRGGRRRDARRRGRRRDARQPSAADDAGRPE